MDANKTLFEAVAAIGQTTEGDCHIIANIDGPESFRVYIKKTCCFVVTKETVEGDTEYFFYLVWPGTTVRDPESAFIVISAFKNKKE
jgi:hypothetical protein